MQRTFLTICRFFEKYLQIPTVVITPGAQPLTGMALSVASYSGHILKLVPGDHQYEFAQFPIVITWNGTEKFGPTQFLRANVVHDWKLGIVQRHISEALKIFEEVEGDLYDSENPGLFRWFKFTLKPPNRITGEKLRLAIWDTSFWTFWLKFGHKGP